MQMEDYKVIVAGSREYTDYKTLAATLDKLLTHKLPVTIVSGTARGTDRMGEAYAIERKLPLLRFPANWRYGKQAGRLRNAQMAEEAHALIAFWDGKSPGTAHMIKIAKDKGLAVRVIKI